jgi:hypothetical protein
MISNWMWFFQRNDANMRNEWSNYTNWPYTQLPDDIQPAPLTNDSAVQGLNGKYYYGPGINPPTVDQTVGNNTGLYITGPFSQENPSDIMVSMAISLNGAYRENVLPAEVYQYIDRYARSNGSGKRGLYHYNFCLNTSPYDYQPSGGMNLSKFRDINLEITTISPVVSLDNSKYKVICDLSGNPLGITKQNWRLYDYTFNMTMYEERYNILSFVGGNCGMLYAR